MLKKISQFLDSLMLKDILTGMSITGRYLFKPKITVQYPEEKTPLSPRFRGLHALRRYESGEERCIGCINKTTFYFYLPIHENVENVFTHRRYPFARAQR